MATLTSCSITPAQLVMNYVEPSGNYILKMSSNSALASTIEARNMQSSTFSSGEMYSSSNYLKIKRIALDGSIVNTDTGNCLATFVPGANLLGMAVPSRSTLQSEINKILAKG